MNGNRSVEFIPEQDLVNFKEEFPERSVAYELIVQVCNDGDVVFQVVENRSSSFRCATTLLKSSEVDQLIKFLQERK